MSGTVAVEPEALSWVACGDSFTAGIDEQSSWVTAAAPWLSGLRVKLHNVAVVGATMAQIENEQLPQVRRARPDLLSVICGANDVIGAVRIDPQELESRVDRLFRSARQSAASSEVLTSTYPPLAASAFRPRTRRRIESGMAQLNRLIRAAAAEHGLTCLEFAEHPGAQDPGNYAADGFHPSAAGAAAAAAVLAPAVVNALKKRRSNELYSQ